jgi:hypothetical protein
MAEKALFGLVMTSNLKSSRWATVDGLEDLNLHAVVFRKAA